MNTIKNTNILFQSVMARGRLIARSADNSVSYGLMRCFCKNEKGSKSNDKESTSPSDTSYSTQEKFKHFRDEDSPVILDVFEERFKALQVETETVDQFTGVNLARGVEGVFDVGDLVDVLRREKAREIFVVKIPPEFKYVNHIVIASGKSGRHMKALAEFIRMVFKRKRHQGDIIPKIEGQDSKDWIALDLGNIALHIFSEEARSVYDLESLWSLGTNFDEKSCQPEDPVIELLRKHSVYLGDLQPATTRQ